MKYLISTVETYRIDTEAEVEQMIADAKKSLSHIGIKPQKIQEFEEACMCLQTVLNRTNHASE